MSYQKTELRREQRKQAKHAKWCKEWNEWHEKKVMNTYGWETSAAYGIEPEEWLKNNPEPK